METRIPGSLDMPRLDGSQRTIDAEAKHSVRSGDSAAVSSARHVIASEAPVKSEAEAKERPDLQAAVVEMNDFVQSVSRDIDFKLEDDSGRVVVSITDRETGNVIRQIPSEEALKLAESLSEARSLMLKTEV